MSTPRRPRRVAAATAEPNRRAAALGLRMRPHPRLRRPLQLVAARPVLKRRHSGTTQDRRRSTSHGRRARQHHPHQTWKTPRRHGRRRHGRRRHGRRHLTPSRSVKTAPSSERPPRRQPVRLRGWPPHASPPLRASPSRPIHACGTVPGPPSTMRRRGSGGTTVSCIRCKRTLARRHPHR